MYKVDGQKLLQYPGELERLIEIFRENNVKSYLEIGCKFGGSLWMVGRSMPRGSRIVGVDLMKHMEWENRLRMAASRITGIYVDLIKGDSTDPDIVSKVKRFAPFDACLIDANHSLPYVTKDWENYGPMCKLVAFHDINYIRSPDEWKEIQAQVKSDPGGMFAIDVPPFWDKIKNGYKHEEIKLDKRDNGIGVLWR